MNWLTGSARQRAAIPPRLRKHGRLDNWAFLTSRSRRQRVGERRRISECRSTAAAGREAGCLSAAPSPSHPLRRRAGAPRRFIINETLSELPVRRLCQLSPAGRSGRAPKTPGYTDLPILSAPPGAAHPSARLRPSRRPRQAKVCGTAPSSKRRRRRSDSVFGCLLSPNYPS